MFDTSRGSLVDTLKVVVSDVKWFLLFIFLTMLSFGIAFSILYRDEVIEIGDGEEEGEDKEEDKVISSVFSWSIIRSL